MELQAVQRVLSFTQRTWLKPFVNFNMEKLKAAQNPFENNFFKLMNEAPYGMSLVNVRKRIDFYLVVDKRKLMKLTANFRVQHFFRYNEYLFCISMKNVRSS